MWLVSFTYSKGMATCPPKHVPKHAGLAQLGERQTEDLKVMCSIHITCNFFFGIFGYQVLQDISSSFLLFGLK
jgi:hypothetical protein